MAKRKTQAAAPLSREMIQVPVPAGTKAALQARFPGRKVAAIVRDALAAQLDMPELIDMQPGRPWPAKDA